uniref:Sodium/calcium exchanger membrane region domain-containing protein n=1 Tax=Oncorhynchus tshawytscha TaxID=74940 RepID=A0AAZ3PPG8_ONCTS
VEEETPLTEVHDEDQRIADMGRPTLGDHVKLEIIIEESYEFKNTVDKLIKKTNLALLVGTNSWRDQFIEAITVSAGEDEDEECSEEKLPSCFDYVMHFLTVFWKVLFAFVPPTDYWNGWACFVVSICMIGLLTAFIGDLASHFGCTVGLKDSVTAVVFVALGTSVPGNIIYSHWCLRCVYLLCNSHGSIPFTEDIRCTTTLPWYKLHSAVMKIKTKCVCVKGGVPEGLVVGYQKG